MEPSGKVGGLVYRVCLKKTGAYLELMTFEIRGKEPVTGELSHLMLRKSGRYRSTSLEAIMWHSVEPTVEGAYRKAQKELTSKVEDAEQALQDARADLNSVNIKLVALRTNSSNSS